MLCTHIKQHVPSAALELAIGQAALVMVSKHCPSRFTGPLIVSFVMSMGDTNEARTLPNTAVITDQLVASIDHCVRSSAEVKAGG